MRKYLTILLLILCHVAMMADTTVAQKAEAYIKKYSEMAVAEMYRSGVPASITLAQGLLESGYGVSALAKESNNHFGIKCHADWTGDRVYHDDDQKGECFRKYPTVADSYADHGDFLRYKPRYAFLFDYQNTDYKSWCHGLKKAGYATDPKYAFKLIDIIETYKLYRFDKQKPLHAKDEDGNEVAPEDLKTPQSPSVLETASRFKGTGNSGTYAVSLSREVMEINGVPFIYAREGESYKSIAALYDLFPKELMAFNDEKADRTFTRPEVIYLRHKQKYAVKGLQKHICSEGETLREISQKYAVSMSSLMKLNNIKNAAKYEVGEDNTLLLRPGKKD